MSRLLPATIPQDGIVKQRLIPFMFSDIVKLYMCATRQGINGDVTITLLYNGNVIDIPCGFEIFLLHGNSWLQLAPKSGNTYWVRTDQTLQIKLHGDTMTTITADSSL